MRANYKHKLKVMAAAVTLSTAIAVSANAATTDQTTGAAEASQPVQTQIVQVQDDSNDNSYASIISSAMQTVNNEKEKADSAIQNAFTHQATPDDTNNSSTIDTLKKVGRVAGAGVAVKAVADTAVKPVVASAVVGSALAKTAVDGGLALGTGTAVATKALADTALVNYEALHAVKDTVNALVLTDVLTKTAVAMIGAPAVIGTTAAVVGGTTALVGASLAARAIVHAIAAVPVIQALTAIPVGTALATKPIIDTALLAVPAVGLAATAVPLAVTALNAVGLGTLALPVANAVALGAMSLPVLGALGLGAATLPVAGALALGALTLPAVGALGLGALSLPVLGALGFGAMSFPILGALTLNALGLGALALGGLNALALGAGALLGLGVMNALGLGALALGGLGALALGAYPLLRLLAPIIGGIQWTQLAHAWGRFIGAVIGGLAAFFIAGAIGFTIGLPGTKIPYAILWQLICVPLWNVLGAFNGQLICTPLGLILGPMIGLAVPDWEVTLGQLILPAFALLWDSLATAFELGSQAISLLGQWAPRYLLRNLDMLAMVFLPDAFRSLWNILTLRYGPLFNRIHVMTTFSDSVDSGWGSLGYLLYGKTVVDNVPVLDSAPQLVARALGAIDNQFSVPGGRTNEILFLLDPFYIPDYEMRNQMEYLSNGEINFWKFLATKFFARMSVRLSQVVTLNIGSNDLWVPFMSALYDMMEDGRLPGDHLTITERSALFGPVISLLSNVASLYRAWLFATPVKRMNYTMKLMAGVIKEYTDYFINLPLIMLHIFLLNPFATLVVEGTENPVQNWDLIPGIDDNLIMYAAAPIYEIQNLYKKILVALYPGRAIYVDMYGIQLKGERLTIPLFENLTLDRSGFDPHPSFIGRRQQADRILRALGQPSPYGIYELPYLVPSFFWNIVYPYSPLTLIHPFWARFRPLDFPKLTSLYNAQTILPSVTGNLPINY